MKNTLFILGLILFLTFVCHGLTKTAIQSLDSVNKPAIVFSKYTSDKWYEVNCLTVKDRNGSLIEITGEHVNQLIIKYKVGDTIK